MRLAEAPSHGVPVLVFDAASKGAQAYLALAGEMLNAQRTDSMKAERMAKVKGLGRGLDALLGGDEPQPPADEALRDAADRCSCSPARYQPRTRMDQRRSPSWPNRSSAQGVMQPILVRPVARRAATRSSPASAAGARRGWPGSADVPGAGARRARRAALAIGADREHPARGPEPAGGGAGIQRLIEEFRHDPRAGRRGASAARAAAVTNLLRLLELAPPVQEMLAEGALDMGHARALLALPTRAPDRARAAQSRRKGLSVRETERLVQHGAARPARRAAARSTATSRGCEEESSRAPGHDGRDPSRAGKAAASSVHRTTPASTTSTSCVKKLALSACSACASML